MEVAKTYHYPILSWLLVNQRSDNQVQKQSQAENLMELLAFYSMKKNDSKTHPHETVEVIKLHCMILGAQQSINSASLLLTTFYLFSSSLKIVPK